MGTYSKLHNYTYQKLKRNFPEFTIRENIHPDWLISSDLTRLELDLFIEEINTAIEVQGEQHYRFIPHFHGDNDGYKKRLRFDQEKRELCYGKGVKLIEVANQSDVDLFIQEISPKIPEYSPKYSYSYSGIDPSKQVYDNSQYSENAIRVRGYLRIMRREIKKNRPDRFLKYFQKSMDKNGNIDDQEIMQYYRSITS